MIEALLIFDQHIHALLQHLILLQQFQDQFGHTFLRVLRLGYLCDQFGIVDGGLYASLVIGLEYMVNKFDKLH